MRGGGAGSYSQSIGYIRMKWFSNASVRDYFATYERVFVYKIEKVYSEIYWKRFPDSRYKNHVLSAPLTDNHT